VPVQVRPSLPILIAQKHQTPRLDVPIAGSVVWEPWRCLEAGLIADHHGLIFFARNAIGILTRHDGEGEGGILAQGPGIDRLKPLLWRFGREADAATGHDGRAGFRISPCRQEQIHHAAAAGQRCANGEVELVALSQEITLGEIDRIGGGLRRADRADQARARTQL
jgi:hypothetical protein